ncbi:MAG: hypothetical protein E6929_07755 [Clostridium sp.]|nr:hypothetical protein [Clostridium sp.]
MSKKNNFKILLEGFRDFAESKYNQIEEINKSKNYTDEGKVELTTKLQNEVMSQASSVRKKALEILDGAKSEISSLNKVKTDDEAYQLKLANTIKLIEYGADELKNEELSQLVEAFRDDRVSAIALRGALKKANVDIVSINSVLPLNSRLDDISFIEGIKNNINNYIGSYNPWGGLTGVSVAITGMIQSLDRLDDNLKLIH